MKSLRVIATIFLTTALAGSAAYAADQVAKPAASSINASSNKAEKAVGKLSTGGMAAFRDIHMARLAIFNADPKEATSLVDQAQVALQKAKTDETAYQKAESAMMASQDKKKDDAAKAADTNAQPIAWLPIDGQLTIGEDFTASPAKQEALKKANDSVHKGDQKGAIETLKLADVDVDFAMAVLPLDKTVQDVDQAATLIKDGKYYEANAVLKRTEESVRFDTVDLTETPALAAESQKAEPATPPAK